MLFECFLVNRVGFGKSFIIVGIFENFLRGDFSVVEEFIAEVYAERYYFEIVFFYKLFRKVACAVE